MPAYGGAPPSGYTGGPPSALQPGNVSDMYVPTSCENRSPHVESIPGISRLPSPSGLGKQRFLVFCVCFFYFFLLPQHPRDRPQIHHVGIQPRLCAIRLTATSVFFTSSWILLETSAAHFSLPRTIAGLWAPTSTSTARPALCLLRLALPGTTALWTAWTSWTNWIAIPRTTTTRATPVSWTATISWTTAVLCTVEPQRPITTYLFRA